MSYWRFTTKAACEAAEALATATLPDDTDINGTVAAVQVTTRWADPAQDIGGKWFIPAKPGMVVPAGGVAVDAIDPLPA